MTKDEKAKQPRDHADLLAFIVTKLPDLSVEELTKIIDEAADEKKQQEHRPKKMRGALAKHDQLKP